MADQKTILALPVMSFVRMLALKRSFSSEIFSALNPQARDYGLLPPVQSEETSSFSVEEDSFSQTITNNISILYYQLNLKDINLLISIIANKYPEQKSEQMVDNTGLETNADAIENTKIGLEIGWLVNVVTKASIRAYKETLENYTSTEFTESNKNQAKKAILEASIAVVIKSIREQFQYNFVDIESDFSKKLLLEIESQKKQCDQNPTEYIAGVKKTQQEDAKIASEVLKKDEEQKKPNVSSSVNLHMVRRDNDIIQQSVPGTDLSHKAFIAFTVLGIAALAAAIILFPPFGLVAGVAAWIGIACTAASGAFLGLGAIFGLKSDSLKNWFKSLSTPAAVGLLIGGFLLSAALLLSGVGAIVVLAAKVSAALVAATASVELGTMVSIGVTGVVAGASLITACAYGAHVLRHRNDVVPMLMDSAQVRSAALTAADAKFGPSGNSALVSHPMQSNFVTPEVNVESKAVPRT